MEEIKSKDISAAEFQQRILESDKVHIIDVREQIEFSTFNFGGENIPLSKLMNTADVLNYDKQMEIILVCQHGLRSKTAKLELMKRGYLNVRNLIGGILAIRKLHTNPFPESSDDHKKNN